ncbi:restriction endonuclease subunit S [Phytobacter sp. V91]|uniref:restriction endonuclease subunit S n=1 Tax=Phytobacter sp. V91 TaxID=3369425 RepID=UPI003F6361E5
MSQWIQIKLGEIVTLNYGKALKAQDRNAGSIPVYSSGGLTGWHDCALINDNGIIVGRKGTVGKSYLTNGPFWCIDTAYYILPNPSKYHFIFLFYLLKTLGLEELNEDSAVPGLNRDTAYTQILSLPPLPEQKAIASVLSSLDDKIDLLHRQNKTLESMAETLFRQWFIEEAQEDWPETTIGEVFTLNGGSTPSTKNDDFWDGDISWTSPRDLSGSESIFLMSTERKITSLGLKRISSGLLPVRTLLMSSRAPIGYLSITDIPVAINQGYIAIRESSHYHSEYMYLWCKLNMEIIKNSGNGSVFQEISKSSFRDLTFIEPPKEKVLSFNELTRDLFEKNRLNTKQIRRLEKLRNTLLPKLMSGDVRVQYVEEAIASVA